MATADLLVEQMFFWMKEREECANKLEKLAQELESLRKKCNAAQAVGSSVTVVGAACLIGAGVATACTGGAAAPGLTTAGGVCTGVGVGISVITKLTEHLIESDTMEDAKEAERNGRKITERIQRLYEQLKEEWKKANPNADLDDLDQHTMTEIVGAIAKLNGLDPHFSKQSLQEHFSCDGPGAMDVDMNSLQFRLEVGLARVFTFFGLKASGKEFKILFAKGVEELIKKFSRIGVNAVLKGSIMAVGGAIVMAFALPEAIKHWKDLIENNNVTEASKSLRDTADALRQLNRTLSAQLDKIKQTLEELHQLRLKQLRQETERLEKERLENERMIQLQQKQLKLNELKLIQLQQEQLKLNELKLIQLQQEQLKLNELKLLH